MLIWSCSYVASLEARIEKLEKRLAYAQQRRSSVSMHEDFSAESPDRKDSLATIRAVIQNTAAKRRETTDVNELVSDFGFLYALQKGFIIKWITNFSQISKCDHA